MSDTDSTSEVDSQTDTEVNPSGDDNVSVVVAPPEVTVNVEVAPETPAEDASTTTELDLSTLVGTAVSAALAPLVESVNSLSSRVSALETPVIPDVITEPVTEVIEEPVTEEDEDQNTEDAPPKSRRDHWFFRDHETPFHKTG